MTMTFVFPAAGFLCSPLFFKVEVAIVSSHVNATRTIVRTVFGVTNPNHFRERRLNITLQEDPMKSLQLPV